MDNFSHIPVLLEDAIAALKVYQGKKYIDATLGGGGHTKKILEKGGLVIGIDKDIDAIEHVRNSLKSYIENGALTVVKGNFSKIKKIAIENNFDKVSGILFDIGVSSYQLNKARRGFSFIHDEQLDMRMDITQKLTAYDVVNLYPKEKLVELFYRYGEEHNAVKIAEAITKVRKKKEIRTTKDLVQIIEGVPHRRETIHPATRIFQAIRIEVNGELEELKRGLSDGVDLLEVGGRMVVISFHSLEDRIVKQTFDYFEKSGYGIVTTKKPIIATFDEKAKNKRSRSAKMRVFERK